MAHERPILPALMALVAAFITPSCVGVVYVGERTGTIVHPGISSPGEICAASAWHVATEEEVRRVWGEPDRVFRNPDGSVEWTYNGDIRWSGLLVFALVVPLPLMIPVGREHVSLAFHEGRAAVGRAVASEELWDVFLGFHLHDGWTAECKTREHPGMPEVHLRY